MKLHRICTDKHMPLTEEHNSLLVTLMKHQTYELLTHRPSKTHISAASSVAPTNNIDSSTILISMPLNSLSSFSFSTLFSFGICCSTVGDSSCPARSCSACCCGSLGNDCGSSMSMLGPLTKLDKLGDGPGLHPPSDDDGRAAPTPAPPDSAKLKLPAFSLSTLFLPALLLVALDPGLDLRANFGERIACLCLGGLPALPFSRVASPSRHAASAPAPHRSPKSDSSSVSPLLSSSPSSSSRSGSLHRQLPQLEVSLLALLPWLCCGRGTLSNPISSYGSTGAPPPDASLRARIGLPPSSASSGASLALPRSSIGECRTKGRFREHSACSNSSALRSLERRLKKEQDLRRDLSPLPCECDWRGVEPEAELGRL
mmetsp:Transcript_19037/g.55273  ORF Transcript_19037/g.55273 Transcript_19037/m.55273 type:complete len:372 (+) Transcript_19037:59-1174(+)